MLNKMGLMFQPRNYQAFFIAILGTAKWTIASISRYSNTPHCRKTLFAAPQDIH